MATMTGVWPEFQKREKSQSNEISLFSQRMTDKSLVHLLE